MKEIHKTTDVGDFHVSSVLTDTEHYNLNETCVFDNESNHSEVIGTYEDHSIIVRAIEFATGRTAQRTEVKPYSFE